jgi:hypothetical protein
VPSATRWLGRASRRASSYNSSNSNSSSSNNSSFNNTNSSASSQHQAPPLASTLVLASLALISAPALGLVLALVCRRPAAVAPFRRCHRHHRCHRRRPPLCSQPPPPLPLPLLLLLPPARHPLVLLVLLST